MVQQKNAEEERESDGRQGAEDGLPTPAAQEEDGGGKENQENQRAHHEGLGGGLREAARPDQGAQQQGHAAAQTEQGAEGGMGHGITA